MTDARRSTRARMTGPSVESTFLTLAVLALVVALLSTVTLVPRNASSGSGEAGPVGPGGVFGGVGATEFSPEGGSGSGSGRFGGGGSAGGAAGAVEGQAGPGSIGGEAAREAGSGQGGAGSSAGVGAQGPVGCSAAENGGTTDTGVTANSLRLGAVTVDDGPGASFLADMSVAVQAVVKKINDAGGICGRRIDLLLRNSSWEADKGLQIIKNLVEGEDVFALIVNPDSEGLHLASTSGYIQRQKVPVIGTDGLLQSQYQDPYIWPVAASTATAMHAIAISQNRAKRSNYSIVYETTYRFGREGAKAYRNKVKALTGKDIPGYSDPDTSPQCRERFCGIVANQQGGYGSQANELNGACGNNCDAGVVLLEPQTATSWFNSGGRFGGVSNPSEGRGAAGQPLFTRGFADSCQKTCNKLRLWTGFLPPIEKFANEKGVRTYLDDLRDFPVDVNNQFAEGAYLGARLAMDVIKTASTRSGGLTRENVVAVLDSTRGYDIGLTVKPLSWSKGNHYPLTSVHAFDENYAIGFGGWQFVQGSETVDPNPQKL